MNDENCVGEKYCIIFFSRATFLQIMRIPRFFLKKKTNILGSKIPKSLKRDFFKLRGYAIFITKASRPIDAS